MNLFCRFIRWLFCKDNPMSVQLSPIGNAAQFFTVNGAPLNAGQLFTYAAGTSTPQATFTSSAGSIQNANPIILGVDGRPPNEVWLTNNVSYKFVLEDSANVVLGTYDNISGIASQLVLNSYLAGLTLSASGSSASMGIAAGQATDTTNIAVMTLAASITKTTAGWAVGSGNGGLDSGSIANTTWYHFFLMQRLDTGVVDVLISLNPAAPALPTNYNIFRRIGSGLTDGAAQWVAFRQDGDLFQWKTPLQTDINANNPGTSAVTRTLTVPTGVNVIAVMTLNLSNSDATASTLYLSDLQTNDEPAVSFGFGQVGPARLAGGAATGASAPVQVRTNTAAQIRTRIDYSSANVTITGGTLGWIDRRGRDA